MPYWAAARCPVWREKVIAERVEQELGCVVFLPKVRLARRGVQKPVLAALFAGYFFVDLDASPPWQAIRRCPGVAGLVMAGAKPARCPQGEIDKLKAAEVGGVVKLAGAPPPPPPRHRPAVGQKVKILFGPLDGQEARYAGEAAKARRSRSRVLVELLGRQVLVELASHAIAAQGGSQWIGSDTSSARSPSSASSRRPASTPPSAGRSGSKPGARSSVT